MKERYLLSEQAEIKAVLDPGLTANAKGSYAEYGEIFMAEAIAEQKEANVRQADQNGTENGHEEHNSYEVAVAQSLSEKEITDKREDNKLNWEVWKEENKKEISDSDYQLLEALERHGITPDQFAKNKDFYKTNRVLFETKLDPKEVARLIHVWKKFFDSSPQAQNEFTAKWHIIATLAIAAGLSPRGFARKFKWSSYFEAPPPPTVGGILKQFLKDFIVDIVAGAAAPVYDQSKTAEENRKIQDERKQALANVLWGAVNEKRKQEGEIIKPTELATQKHAIEIGALPETRTEIERGLVPEQVVFINAELDDDQRVREAESLLGVTLNEGQKAALLRAHYYGRDLAGKDGTKAQVFNFTEEQIAEKARLLHTHFTRDQRRLLMEVGIAGARESRNEWVGRGLNDEQVQNAESIIQMMISSGFGLDWDNPTIIAQVGKIAREIPAGRKIQQEDFDRVKAIILARKTKELKDFTEAQQISEEEKTNRQKMWAEWIEGNKENIVNLPDEGRQYFHKDVQWARANNITPEQAGISFSDYTRARNYGKEYKPDEKPEEVKSADIPRTNMSPREKELFDKEWKRFSENLSIIGIDPNSEDVVRQIEQAREQGIFPSEFEFNMPHVDREHMEDVLLAWEDLAQIRYEMGDPLTKDEQKVMANMIKRGEYPPDSMYPSEALESAGGGKRRKKRNEGTTGLVQLENGERIQGRLTMWEEIVEFMNQRGQAYASNREYIGGNQQRMAEVRYGLEEQLFENRTPDNIEDIAWQIGRSAPDKYGVTGKHPVLEVVYKTNVIRNGKEIKAGSRVKIEQDLYNEEISVSRVNQGNFMRWLRDRMLTLHGDEPDDPLNFEAQISIDKSFRPFYFAEARKNTQKYFRSEFRAREHQALKTQIAKETDPEKIRELKRKLSVLDPIVMENLAELGFKQATWSYGVDRDNNLNYRFRSGNKEEFVKMMMEKLARSAFTKTAWGKSLFEWILTWDQNFGEEDHKLGAAINGAYLIYYNLTDTYKLYEMLGSKSALLSEEGLKKSRDEAAGIYDEDGNVTKEYGLQQAGREELAENKEKADAARKAYMSDASIHKLFRYSEEEMTKLQDASGGKLKFEKAEDDKDGKPQWKEVDQNGNQLINEWRYIKTLNINQSPQFDTRLENVVHTAIKRDIARVFDLTIPDEDDEERKVRDVLNVSFAQNFAHLMTNWTGAMARNNQTAAGYDAYVALLKTRTYRLKYAANKRAEAYGNPHTMHMFKGLITDVMAGIRTETVITEDEISKEGSRYANRTTKSYKSPHEVMEEMYNSWIQGGSPEEIRKRYMEKSGQLLFPANTLKYYANDQIMRGMAIYDQIIDAQEIKLEKFTRIDPWKGVTFERDQFQAAVQEKFLKPMRYLLSTWQQTDFSQMVRTNVAAGAETDWQEMSLAESMFGREMLDVPEFWEEVEEGTPGAKKFETRNKDGDYKDTWRIPHKISGKEINNNRTQLIKQMAKMRIAAELYEHVDLHSTDPRYNFIYYETIIQALETLPGGIHGDETDMKKSRTKIGKRERYFSPVDIDWIRQKSHTEQWRTIGQAILFDSIGKGLWGGIVDAFKISAKHITGDLK